ncbi:MAG: class I SAM-dependent methyltransferase [Thermodesulfobacteriota bacterium]
MDKHFLEILFNVQSGLKRQGPGDDDSTREVLQACNLPVKADILDIGCGPGAQTMVVAGQLPDASIMAVDFHAPYLMQLEERAQAAGYADRITTYRGDMNELPFSPESFDLIIAEGSAYIMGFVNALKSWKPLLRNNGYIAVTELVWLTITPPEEAATFFNEEYPAMTTPENIIMAVQEAGYKPLKHFTVPDKGWWVEYYTPLADRLDLLEKKYADDETGRTVIQMTRQEIDIRKRFGESYGYEFFIAQNIKE